MKIKLFFLIFFNLLTWPTLAGAVSIHQEEDLYYQKNQAPEITLGPSNSILIGGAPLSEEKKLTKKVFGFHPYWMNSAWKTYDFNLLSSIAYFGADLNGDGTIGQKHDWPVTDLISAAHQRNIKVSLVAKNFSTTSIRNLLSSKKNRDNAINNLLKEVKAGNGNGVNIDFEYVPGDQRDNFTTFIKDLSETFHREIPGSEISLDAPAVDWNNSWNIPELVKHADLIMIMGYDYHYIGSLEAGPAAPLESGNLWSKEYNVTKSLDYYVNLAGNNKNKILLGVPYYGYDFPTVSHSIPSSTTGTASAIKYNILKENIESGKRDRLWNNDSHTPYYLYNDGKPHQVWFDDEESLGKKYNIVNERNAGGIGIWALGYDFGRTELWNEISKWLTKEVVPPPPPPPVKNLVIATAPGAGGGPHVRLFDTSGNALPKPDKLFPYSENFRGGVNVAMGDIDADGIDEIITAPKEGGGPQVRVFEQDGTPRGIDLWPFHPNSRTGINVATGDVDGDGKDEIAVAQGENGQAWIKVYRYNTEKTVLGEWNAFGSVPCGASVAMGDVDLDGKDEIIVGAGKGGGPLVRVFEANGEVKPIQFFAFHENYRGGVDVDTGDVDGDGKAEIAVSQKKEQAWVKVYRYNNQQTIYGEWKAYADFPVGTRVSLGDIDNDGKMEVVTAPVIGGPQIRQFEYDGTLIKNINNGKGFFAYDSNFRGGADIAIGKKK